MNVIGLGIDLVEVERIEDMLRTDPGFLRRVFSAEEIDLCDQSPRPAECYAARWAAREACAKALGGIPEGRWREIRVVRAAEGEASIELEGAARDRAREMGAERVLVSFSHERNSAIACCLALGGERQ